MLTAPVFFRWPPLRLALPSTSSASVDRDYVVFAGERFAVPTVPTFLQAQAGDSCHEVELGRPGVSLDDGIQAHARAGEGYVALVEHLLRRIVTKHIEPYRVDFDGLRVDVLIVTQPVEEGGRTCFDHERSVICEVGGDVLEAAHLVFLGQQIE